MKHVLIAYDEDRNPDLEQHLAEFLGENAWVVNGTLDATKSHLGYASEDFTGCSKGGIAMIPIKNFEKVGIQNSS